jgi:hypothetical protein
MPLLSLTQKLNARIIAMAKQYLQTVINPSWTIMAYHIEQQTSNYTNGIIYAMPVRAKERANFFK